MQSTCFTTLLGIQGFQVTAIEQITAVPRSIILVHMERTKEGYFCGECGQEAPGYDHTWQQVQHLTLWQHLTVLRFERYRVDCPTCGIRTEALDFVGIRGPRVTHALARLISELCKVMTNKAVGIFQTLHKHTVKDVDKEAMGTVQAERPLEGMTVLGVDEIAVGKGQKYWTMISAPEGPARPGAAQHRRGAQGEEPQEVLEMVRAGTG